MNGERHMEKILKTKKVSYGTVVLKDHGNSSPRYAIYVNGEIKEISDNRDFMIRTFDTKYH